MRKLSKNNLKKYKSKKYRSKSKKYKFRSKSKKYKFRAKSKKYKFRVKNDGTKKDDKTEELKLEENSKKGDDELSLSKKGDDELSLSLKGEPIKHDEDEKKIEEKFNSIPTSIKHLYLGDSFIKIFDGYNSNKTMLILSFSGKTAKGLNKPENDIRTNLLKILNNLECLILHFGSVDIHFSYFYTLFSRESNIGFNISIEDGDMSKIVKYNIDYISEIVENYVSFINEIKKKNSKLKIFVLIPYYSPVQDEDMLDNLEKYIFRKSSAHKPLLIYSNTIKKKLLSFNNRKSLVDLFDKKMKNKFTDDDRVDIISINDQIIGISKQYLLNDKIDIHLKNEVSDKYKEILEKCGLPKKS